MGDLRCSWRADSLSFVWLDPGITPCCKSRFVPMIKNSAGRGFSFRVRMWGTSSPHVKRAGDFGNATEGTRIGDQFPSCVFAKIPSHATFDFCNNICQLLP